MGWSYRTSHSSSSRKVNASAWQTRGETMSMSNACAQYGVTEEQCREAKLPCQWRSAYGNSYAVVKVSDILDLKRKLAQAKQEEEKQKLIVEHGQEGYERMKKEEEERKEAELDAQKQKAQTEKDQRTIVEQVMTLLTFTREGTAVPDIEGVKLAKTAAKSDFFIDDRDLNDLEGETVGRSIKYNAFDVIQASENSNKHRGYNKQSLEDKIRSKPTHSRTSLYTGYLKKKLELEMEKVSKEAVDGAMKQVQDLLQKEVVESEAKMKAAEEEFENKQAKVRSFQDVFAEDENTKPAPKKKKARKTGA